LTLTSLNKAALVVLDLQVASAALPSTPNSVDQIVERSARLATAFRDKGHEVIWVTVNGAASGRIENTQEWPELPDNWAELLPDLGVEPGDHQFAKQAWGAFHDGRMDALLSDLGVEQVVLTGLTTSFAVESTARAAFERNYNVVIVTDAIGDIDAAVHENSVMRIFPNLAEVVTADDVLAAL
jgi:nicotinamidase-related amidase